MKLTSILFSSVVCMTGVAHARGGDDAAPRTARASTADPLPTVHASIAASSGKFLYLAGKANVAATNAWLARTGQRFVAANPDDFPSEYWGLDFASDAYVFLQVAQQRESTWDLDGAERSGPYSVFRITIQGFSTDANGRRLDVTGDGIVDDEDWIPLEVPTIFQGTSLPDSKVLASFYGHVFGADASAGNVSLDALDADGFPNRAHLGVGKDAVILAVGANNRNRCVLDTELFEQCWYWDPTSYELISAYPAPHSFVKDWALSLGVVNWVVFDAASDTFAVGDARIKSILDAIGFTPLFWARAHDTSSTFDSDSP